MMNFSDDKVDLFVYQEAKSGNLESGDTYYITKTDEFMLCAIADGLGNGPVAKESADIIPKILEEYKEETLDELLLRCNELMVSKRGAAVAIVKIDYKHQTISYSCVGNVKFYMYKRFILYPLWATYQAESKRLIPKHMPVKKMICSCFTQTGL